MTRQLVLVHGRDQQGRNADELKAEWIQSLRKGLDRNGLTLPIAESEIRFPYYGDTLSDLERGVPAEHVASVIVRGEDGDPEEAMFVRNVIMEMQEQLGVPDDAVLEQLDPGERAVVERNILNSTWVQAVLEAIDTHVPYASSATVALTTRDVYQYLKNPGIRATINLGVSQAITSGVETVVVGHSLGSVVTYLLLKEASAAAGWTVPLYVTLGSPLAVRAIREAVTPRKHPSCVTTWFNAYDPRDVVALYPLDDTHFRVNPPIENKGDVDNNTANRHGISGYLSDPVVAKRIHDALTA